MNATIDQLLELYDLSDFSTILSFDNGLYFLKLRSMSRKNLLEKLCKQNAIEPSSKNIFEFVFKQNIPIEKINAFLSTEFLTELDTRDAKFLYRQLYKLDVMDWGGLYQNGLEKTIVNNYVKRIMDYDILSEKIDNELHASMKGYVRTSWYNNWTSVLIEDMFKSHDSVLAAIGKVKNIDFFWCDVPFDLKVTYFPAEFMTLMRAKQQLRPELTELLRFAKENKIDYDKNSRDRMIFKEIYKKIDESEKNECKSFMKSWKVLRKEIIDTTINDPHELALWLYENQSERRFDAAYRIYLILIDTNNLDDSWKLKRNNDLLPNEIHTFLNSSPETKFINVDFIWQNKQFNTKCCMLFIKR